jgi:hypothetical protein
MAQKVRICLFLLWALLIWPVLGQMVAEELKLSQSRQA